MHERYAPRVDAFAMGAARPLAFAAHAADETTHDLDGYRCETCIAEVRPVMRGTRGPCGSCGRSGPVAGYVGATAPDLRAWSLSGFGSLRRVRRLVAVVEALRGRALSS